ncbi:mRNA turnover protein [Chloropicon primus]|uniref:Ribosome assembly factor mrt4 n=3 Tax=Chloropicon primus TaxID=1764295 RepID=A0A5B8MTS4_9CHLO|nr:mRNA turnover protein [Chloropicon primus]UPR02270.1 mRNA turnover protein [Chloropicon primus]|mmetsp:Transcript_28340/g.59785  ORF Transcript_28340/g.59785 Transcript_28340/m.59785 type:complete len:247 (+) Transcript_28340:43-783(+)|eukprot:QDZ23055.1 mRNA turnover protein [Chloropicon primus]
MPRSKRQRVVTLSKVSKKQREWKEGLIEKVRDAVDKFPSVYVFKYKDMKNNSFKALRDKLRESSRFFLGSNKVLQVALGREAADEVRENMSQLSKLIKGHVGLLFTELPLEKVKEEFEGVVEPEFAKAGAKAKETVSFSKGKVDGPHGNKLEHTLEPTLRKNGMPTKLNKGTIELITDFTLCEKGESLTPAQAALLRIFDYKFAQFEMRLLCKWHEDKFEEYEDESEDEESDEDDLEEELNPFEGY